MKKGEVITLLCIIIAAISVAYVINWIASPYEPDYQPKPESKDAIPTKIPQPMEVLTSPAPTEPTVILTAETDPEKPTTTILKWKTYNFPEITGEYVFDFEEKGHYSNKWTLAYSGVPMNELKRIPLDGKDFYERETGPYFVDYRLVVTIYRDQANSRFSAVSNMVSVNYANKTSIVPVDKKCLVSPYSIDMITYRSERESRFLWFDSVPPLIKTGSSLNFTLISGDKIYKGNGVVQENHNFVETNNAWETYVKFSPPLPVEKNEGYPERGDLIINLRDC